MPKEEPLKQGEPSDSVKCSVGNTVPVQIPISPAATETRQPLLLNPNGSLFSPPPSSLMNGTSQLPFMHQFLNLNALILARNIQQMSSQLLNNACEKCELRRDPNCQCAMTLPQGLGMPRLSGLPPFLPFLPQPSLLDYSRMSMPSLPPLWHPTSQGMFQYPTSTATNSVLSVLNDHCYLNKAQMQKLSPKSHVSFVPVSQQQSPKQNKVNQTKSSDNKKSNKRTKVESHLSSPKDDRLHATSVKFSLESPAEQDCHRLNVSDPGIQIQNNHVKEEKQELSVDTHSINETKSRSAIAKDNLTLGRSVSEQFICDKTEDDDQAVPSRKRKMVRSTSVPGWFGKGLNLKKKRRI